MIYTESIGDKLALQLSIASAVSKYAEGKDLPKKMTELLKELLFENLREDANDEDMISILETACEQKRLDPEDVMAHFAAISENLQNLLSSD